MNVKALAAVVGTLSLGALATGCASNKASEGKVHAASPGAPEASESSAAPADGAAPAATHEKGAEGSCGAGSCGAGSCSGKK
ncbi:hypothetical protein [Corallococcus sp. EGB]|uniref:hypothetical protein n=1 Tax=Corallococcus sp. EGB TaxID=1521117 RepID=UPI001CC0733C|nr:hypothetical protein [Corallococcus sp. EGB]